MKRLPAICCTICLLLVLVLTVSCASTTQTPKSAVPSPTPAVQIERAVTADSIGKLWLAARDGLLTLEEKYKNSEQPFTIYTRDITRSNFVAYQLLRNGWFRDERVRIEVYLMPTPLTTAQNAFTVRVRLVPELRRLALLEWFEWDETNAFTPQESLATETLDAIQQKL